MWKRANPSFLTIFRRAELRSDVAQELKENLKAACEPDTESPPFKPTTEEATARAVNPSISNPLITGERKNTMREIAIQESKRIFVVDSGTSMKKTVEDALSDAHLRRLRENKYRTQKRIKLFVEGNFTEMATESSFGEMLECNLICQTQSFSFMETFTQRVLNFLRFVETVEKFSRKNLKVQVVIAEQKRIITDNP